MSTLGISTTEILKVKSNSKEETNDLLVREEPMEIRIGYGSASRRKEFPLAVTMRTPGADEELAYGFLLSEGIVPSASAIVSAKYCLQAKQPENTLKVELIHDLPFDPEAFKRNFFTSSSCGVCGKAALDAVICKIPKIEQRHLEVKENTLLELTRKIQAHQNTFNYTGGLHAAALFTVTGELLALREDIGRHNALDKLIGVCAIKQIDLSDKILWLSGRVGFELVQKAAVAGIRVIVALGAPSALSVDLARETHTTLVGFLKKGSFNIYSEKERIALNS